MIGHKQFWCVSAFSTAEEFHLEELLVALTKTKLYEPTCLYSGSDDCVGEWITIIYSTVYNILNRFQNPHLSTSSMQCLSSMSLMNPGICIFFERVQ